MYFATHPNVLHLLVCHDGETRMSTLELTFMFYPLWYIFGFRKGNFRIVMGSAQSWLLCVEIVFECVMFTFRYEDKVKLDTHSLPLSLTCFSSLIDYTLLVFRDEFKHSQR